MSQRTLLHVLLIAVAVIVILMFPEFRGRDSMAEYSRAERSNGLPEGNAPAFELRDGLTQLAAEAGIRGRVVQPSGEPVADLEIEAVGLDAYGEGVEGGSGQVTSSLEDGSFELLWADPSDALELPGSDYAILDERRGVRGDGSASVTLIVAPTAAVAGRIPGAPAGRPVRLVAVHRVSELVDEAGEASELTYERTVETGADGRFDFGRVPCSDGAHLQSHDDQGQPLHAELKRAGNPDVVLVP
jgi:hypothetical protein